MITTSRGALHKYQLRSIIEVFRPFIGSYIVIVLLVLVGIGSSLSVPYLFKTLVDHGLAAKNPTVFAWCTGEILLATLLGLMAQAVMDLMHEYVGSHFTKELRRRLFSVLLSQPPGFELPLARGDLYSRIINDSSEVYAIVVSLLIGAFGECCILAGTLYAMMSLNLHISIITLLLSLPMLLLVYLSGPRLEARALTVKREEAQLSEFILERIASTTVIKTHKRVDHEIKGYNICSDKVIAAVMQSVKVRFTSSFLLNVIASVALTGSLFIEGKMVLNGAITLGTLLALYMYTGKLFMPLQSLCGRSFSLSSSLAALERVAFILSLYPAPRILPGPGIPRTDGYAMSFKDVTVAYSDESPPIVIAATFTLNHGDKCVLTGRSGSGKTTLLKAMAAMLPIRSGSIYIDGISLSDMTPERVFELVSFVGQEVNLFNASVRYNIVYGRPNATEEEVLSAIAAAQLDSLIDELPEGIDTKIGLNGEKLSGGQRQRVVLARLIVQDRPIWLLDEFTSSLDEETEADVFEALSAVWKKKTVIMASHRRSAFRHANHSLAINERNVSHAHLIAQHEAIVSTREIMPLEIQLS